MAKRYNASLFYLLLLCLALAGYSLYANIQHTWLIAPPNVVLLIMSVLALVLGIVGFKDTSSWRAKTRSWVTVILSSLTLIGLILAISFTTFFSSMGGNEHFKTASSPDGQYTIDFHRYDAGAAGSFGVRGALNGPLWFKKRIYHENGTETVDVNWMSDHKVSINQHPLNLDNGGTYGY